MKKVIRFKFDFEKFLNVMSYFASGVQDFDTYKACKLLYLLDREHLRLCGEPVIGDTYFRMDYGPVPSISYDIMSEAIISKESGVSEDEPNRASFIEYLYVDDLPGHKYPVFKSKKEADLDVLSELEEEVLKRVVKTYSKMNFNKLKNLTHNHATWQKTDRNSEIDYRLFFDEMDDDEKKVLISQLESDQDDREIFDLP